MRHTPATKQENARLDVYVSELAYFYSLRDWLVAELARHRQNVWWRRWAKGNRLHERYLIRKIRAINQLIYNELNLGYL